MRVLGKIFLLVFNSNLTAEFIAWKFIIICICRRYPERGENCLLITLKKFVIMIGKTTRRLF